MLAEGTTSGGKELEPVRRCGAPSTRHSFVRRELIRKQGHIVLMYMLRFVPQQCSARSKIFRVTPNPRVQKRVQLYRGRERKLLFSYSSRGGTVIGHRALIRHCYSWVSLGSPYYSNYPCFLTVQLLFSHSHVS